MTTLPGLIISFFLTCFLSSFIMQISEHILYKNNQLIAFDKPAGIPVQPDLTKDISLADLANIYAKVPVFACHRIDRPASGIVLFAKNKKALAAVNEQFRNQSVSKTYLAVVQSPPPHEQGTLTHHLRTQRSNKSLVFNEPEKDTKVARLTYKLIAASDRYHLLEIELLTGRQHQIRAQLAAIGCFIKGDVKYGARRGNKDRSIHLHSWKMGFDHPVTKERVQLETPWPEGVIWNAMAKL